MKLQTWLILGAVAFAVLKASNPHWYEDLMLRSYAKDRLPPSTLTPDEQSKLQAASLAASAVGLPIGWILEIAVKVKAEDLPVIAKRISDKVKSMGPPPDTTEATLEAYKRTAMAAGGAA